MNKKELTKLLENLNLTDNEKIKLLRLVEAIKNGQIKL